MCHIARSNSCLRRGSWFATGLINFAFAISSGLGAEAAFSPDGKYVYFLSKRWESRKASEPVKLIELDLAKRTTRLLDLSKLNPSGGLVALDRSANGLLLLTGRELFVFDPISAVSSKLCESPEGQGFEDVAADPRTGNIFITCFDQWDRTGTVGWYFLGTEKRLVSVNGRRIRSLVSPTFGGRSLLLFGVRGDLWAGKIDHEPESGSGPSEISNLQAVRVAPLANLETGNFTPAAQGVQGVAAALDSIFVITSRMGGSGYGTLIRMPNLIGPIETVNDFPATISLYARLLAGAKVLEESNFQGNPCASADGALIFYLRAGREMVTRRVTDGSIEVFGTAP